MNPHRRVSATRTIPASPHVIFDLLADPRKHALIDGSGSVHEPRKAPARLSLGATFTMEMKIGLPYMTRNVVVDFVEDRSIAWHHFAHFVWRYDLEPVDGGTTVTESFTYDNPLGLGIMVLGWPKKNQRAMEATLARIEQIVTASA
jgi:uncharacterized protein YndB with AHSA1/START domain